VEGGRDFDEEVEDRIRLTRAYNEQVLASVKGTTTPKVERKRKRRDRNGK